MAFNPFSPSGWEETKPTTQTDPPTERPPPYDETLDGLNCHRCGHWDKYTEANTFLPDGTHVRICYSCKQNPYR